MDLEPRIRRHFEESAELRTSACNVTGADGQDDVTFFHRFGERPGKRGSGPFPDRRFAVVPHRRRNELRSDAFERLLASGVQVAEENEVRIREEGIKPPQNCSACHY